MSHPNPQQHSRPTSLASLALSVCVIAVGCSPARAGDSSSEGDIRWPDRTPTFATSSGNGESSASQTSGAGSGTGHASEITGSQSTSPSDDSTGEHDSDVDSDSSDDLDPNSDTSPSTTSTGGQATSTTLPTTSDETAGSGSTTDETTSTESLGHDSSSSDTESNTASDTSGTDGDVVPTCPALPDDPLDPLFGPLALVWPFSGDCMPDFPISDTFGPRLLASEAYRYDYHRGLDLPAPQGSPVHAVAAGMVTIAASHENYVERLVQIEHCRTGDHAQGNCSMPYYTNYIHVDEVWVEEGQLVEQAALIGTSGRSDSGFGHIHFEIRDLGVRQYDARHPLAYLGYHDDGPPTPRLVERREDPDLGLIVVIGVDLPATQADFKRADVRVEDPAGRILAYQVFDVDDWNETHTERDIDATVDPLDDPELASMSIAPGRFNSSSDIYTLRLEFRGLGLMSPLPEGSLIRVRVHDLRGGRDELLIH